MNIADDEKFAVAFVEPNGEFISAEYESLLRWSAGNYKVSRTINSTKQKRQDYPTAGYTKWQEMR